ncbi:MAG: hypothetical protein QM657_05850 [Lacrimispora sp.]|uniref:hypothetical protein n=1 Tax=Lacrimispora sp. TaxID=2719234 RepID=UPI0039E442EF
MRISSNLFPLSSSINRKSETKKSFSDILLMNRDMIEKEADNVRTVPMNPGDPQKTKLEAEFDDEQLASYFEDYTGEKISTEKHINWNSQGLGKLTSQQQAYLKSAYDVENMDGQSFYNLLSDLSNMGVLSGYDIVRQYRSFPVPGGRNPVGDDIIKHKEDFEKLIAMGRAVPLPQGGYEVCNSFFLGGNILENRQMTYDAASRRLRATLNTPDGFDSPSEYQRAIAEEKKALEAYEKFLDILKLIK